MKPTKAVTNETMLTNKNSTKKSCLILFQFLKENTHGTETPLDEILMVQVFAASQVKLNKAEKPKVHLTYLKRCFHW
jgi:hypothetical protein